MGMTPEDYASSDKKTERDMREMLGSLDKMYGSVDEEDHEAAVELGLLEIRLRIPQYPSVGEALGMDDTPSDGQFEESMMILANLWLKHFTTWEGGQRVKHIDKCEMVGDHQWSRRPHSCPKCFYDRLAEMQEWSWISRAFLDNMHSAVMWGRREKRQ